MTVSNAESRKCAAVNNRVEISHLLLPNLDGIASMRLKLPALRTEMYILQVGIKKILLKALVPRTMALCFFVSPRVPTKY